MLSKMHDLIRFEKIDRNKWILTDSNEIPYLAPYIYQTMILARFKDSTKNKKLRCIDYFYDFINVTFGINGDVFIFKNDLQLTFKCFQAFFIHLENKYLDNYEKAYELWTINVTYWEKLEFLRLQHASKKDLSNLKEKFYKIQELLSYLKKPQPKKSLKIRDVGQELIAFLDENLIPGSSWNPFKNIHVQWTYYIAYLILSMTGVRRGELLNLTQNDIGTGTYFHTIERIYKRKNWINIIENNINNDTRYSTPSLKNKNAIRQIPINNELYDLIQIYIEGFRPKSNSPFLLISLYKIPLSAESLDKTFKKLSISLPSDQLGKLNKIHNLDSFTPHNLRHTAATSDLNHLMSENTEENSFHILRTIYGWNANSAMPKHYAVNSYKNKYEERIQTFNSDRIEKIKRIIGNEKNHNK